MDCLECMEVAQTGCLKDFNLVELKRLVRKPK